MISHHTIKQLSAALLASLRLEAAHDALQVLATFVGGVRTATLKGFLNRVLMDPAIGPPLLRCPASQKHHHPQPGGLLSCTCL